MDEDSVNLLKAGDRIKSKAGKIRTITRVIHFRGRVSSVYLLKTLKVTTGIERLAESCVERFQLKRNYEFYDRPK